MADYNPYQAPTAHVADVGNTGEIELAGRGIRLGSAILDTIFIMVIALPLWFVFHPGIFSGKEPGFMQSLMVTLLTVAIWIALNFSLLARNGQTFAKKMLDIKIVRRDATPASVGRIAGLRMIVPTVLTQIPIVGIIFGLVDSLFIFQESRRTLHDLIADTIVIRA